eukprot:2602911-Pleurochrysis_carterae.AAC.1
MHTAAIAAIAIVAAAIAIVAAAIAIVAVAIAVIAIVAAAIAAIAIAATATATTAATVRLASRFARLRGARARPVLQVAVSDPKLEILEHRLVVQDVESVEHVEIEPFCLREIRERLEEILGRCRTSTCVRASANSTLRARKSICE